MPITTNTTHEQNAHHLVMNGKVQEADEMDNQALQWMRSVFTTYKSGVPCAWHDVKLQPGPEARVTSPAITYLFSQFIDNSCNAANELNRSEVKIALCFYNHEGHIYLKMSDNAGGFTDLAQHESSTTPPNHTEGTKPKLYGGEGVGSGLIKEAANLCANPNRLESHQALDIYRRGNVGKGQEKGAFVQIAFALNSTLSDTPNSPSPERSKSLKAIYLLLLREHWGYREGAGVLRNVLPCIGAFFGSLAIHFSPERFAQRQIQYCATENSSFFPLMEKANNQHYYQQECVDISEQTTLSTPG